MKTMTWWALAAVPALSVPFVAQSPSSGAVAPQSRTGLVRVREGRGEAESPRGEFDRAAWRAKLEAGDLDARERGFDALVELAQRDPEARRALEEWSRDGATGELAWTSRLALRAVDAAPRAGARSRTPDPDRRARAFGGFSDLERRMQELQERFGGMDSLFGDLQRQMEQMRRFAPGSPGGSGGSGTWVLPPGGGGADLHSGRGFSLHSGPDGVKVEISEDENGEQKTKTYEAESLEELLQAHPELRDRIHVDGSGSFFSGTDPFQAPARPLLPSAPAPGTDRERLGIFYEPLSEDEAEKLGLESGQGLRVERLVPGSLAERLGIRPGDVVAELDGRKLFGAEDVKGALAERAPEAEVEVTVYDTKGRRRNLSYTPKASQERPHHDEGAGRSGERF